MSLITGKITRDGAVIDVLVGVSEARRTVLLRNGLPVPKEEALLAQLDTGSFATGLTPEVFQKLGIQPFERILIRTPSTRPGQPCSCDRYDVTLTLLAGTAQTVFSRVYVIASEDFGPEEHIQAIIGRDLLDKCVLRYEGPHKTFELAF
jgi:hypothetical protein